MRTKFYSVEKPDHRELVMGPLVQFEFVLKGRSFSRAVSSWPWLRITKVASRKRMPPSSSSRARLAVGLNAAAT
jgi:hypothetical protein